MGTMRPRAWWLALLLVLAVPGASAEEPCLKLAFDRYCLGGDVKALSPQWGQPSFRESEGERLGLVFQDGPEQVYVLAFKGRIYKVVRRYRAATQLRYDDIYSALRQKYGEGEDHSRFPPYATTPARRLGSIRRGDGRAVYSWQPAAGWSIELSWTREMDIALAYVATELDAQQRASMGGGL
jgi:hypothetical protein